ncbi:MAG TPA: 2-amino-4-hydroxy-6-hydroxymethyldihydropteridine diphosphokinase [Burkholderiales bacterium]|nr:2-amino-4-hydroxy-6-hydroxymethyldihydropteridine diphosphokinase [Burkholderiales bacterium]
MNSNAHRPVDVFIALGSNLADPARQIMLAFDAIAGLPETSLRARSSLYLTAPVGYADQPDFINAVIKINTGLAPRLLLTALLDIEQRQGRERTFRNAPRVIDLDILLYHEMVLDESELTLPHPRMHERAFVLMPLLEIAPEINIPGHGPAICFLKHESSPSVRRVDDKGV